MTLIEIKSVNKTYGKKLTKTKAISDITLSINQGEFVVVLGKSGSGKSTLLSLIGGLEKPTQGNIIINDQSLLDKSENQLAILRRGEIGFIFQHFYLMNAMTSLDNVELPMIISKVSREDRKRRALHLLNKMGLSNRITHFPDELSGGERQRVGIARALANKPNIIIADEPTGDLDSKKGKEIIDLLVNLNEGKSDDVNWSPTVILVTHDRSILKPGMRVITLSDGSIVKDEIV